MKGDMFKLYVFVDLDDQRLFVTTAKKRAKKR